MAALTFLLTLGVGAASEPHHFAFTLLPLVLALSAAVDAGGPRLATLLAALVISLSLAARWPTASVNSDTGRDKDRLLSFLRSSDLERSAVQVHVSWGTYYIAHLFGDREQVVVSLEASSAPKDALGRIRDFARAHGRALVLVTEEPAVVPRFAASWGRPSPPRTFGDWSLVLFAE
jgi:hypothetical protein